MEALVQRLVQNPHDQDAINQAHQAGQSDPKSYAMLLEKVGTATSDPSLACHWLTEAASVWSITLGDAHRAARALMIAIDRDPTQSTPAERLAELYREKGTPRRSWPCWNGARRRWPRSQYAILRLRSQMSALHEARAALVRGAAFSQPRKAIENYRRASSSTQPAQFAIYAARASFTRPPASGSKRCRCSRAEHRAHLRSGAPSRNSTRTRARCGVARATSRTPRRRSAARTMEAVATPRSASRGDRPRGAFRQASRSAPEAELSEARRCSSRSPRSTRVSTGSRIRSARSSSTPAMIARLSSRCTTRSSSAARKTSRCSRRPTRG